MSRIARVVAVDVPYHVTHRGNRRADVFYDDNDRRSYVVDLPAVGCPFGGTRRDPLTGQPMDWCQWLARGVEAEAEERLRRATMTGRPCGSETFALGLEKRLGRHLIPQKRGRKPAVTAEPEVQEEFLR